MVLKFSLRRVFKTIYCISYTKGKRQVLTGTIWKQNKRLISTPKKYQTSRCFMVIQLTVVASQMEKSEILSGKSSSTPRNLPLISNSRICNLQVFDLTVGQLWKILLSRSEKCLVELPTIQSHNKHVPTAKSILMSQCHQIFELSGIRINFGDIKN